MKLSSKSDYGIRALVDLAQNDDGGPIPSSEIARRQTVPESLIGQVLATLRTAGFVRSVRGAQGGHALAQPAEEIKLDDVVEALEGPIAPAACLGSDAVEHCTGAAAQVRLWEDVRRSILSVLADRSLADLATEDVAAVTGGRYQI